MNEEMKELITTCKQILERVESLENVSTLANKENGVDAEILDVSESTIPNEILIEVDNIPEESTAFIDEILQENKLYEKEAILVAIIGIKRGIGVTHQCRLLARSLSNLGLSVAIVDFNESGMIENPEEKMVMYQNANMFTLDEAMYNHEIILLDLGDVANVNKGLFRRCQKRIVVAGNKSWEQQYMKNFFHMFPDGELEKYIYLFNHVPKEQEETIKQGMHEMMKVYFASYSPVPETTDINLTLEIFPEYQNRVQGLKQKKSRKRRIGL